MPPTKTGLSQKPKEEGGEEEEEEFDGKRGVVMVVLHQQEAGFHFGDTPRPQQSSNDTLNRF